MHDDTERYTIGQLARRTGLPARTIRFWSDAGVIPPTTRSANGYRLYDVAAIERLELVHTLRQLGLDLPSVQRVLDRQSTLAEVAETHVHALDAQIRTLRLNRAVLSTVAKRGSTSEEMTFMHKLARMSVRERQQIINDFIDRVFAGVENEDALIIASFMREMPTALADEPPVEQVDAWMVLAELVADESFERALRRMAIHSGSDNRIEFGLTIRPLVLEHAGQALTANIPPDSDQARPILARILPPNLSENESISLLAWLETVTNPKIERYWQLLNQANGRPPQEPTIPAFQWLTTALSFHASQ
ncbi:MerR family transcriptional regulator [Nocardia sp. NPDC051030]|uniref:helix-turn-helix domain-containing protein n=1 Tax=Nocardia sp. NPDC051030 TaxID=3155162 RepID=UPI0034215C14